MNRGVYNDIDLNGFELVVKIFLSIVFGDVDSFLCDRKCCLF